MFGGDEWLIIAIVALVLFGGAQLPKLARSLGEAQRELKRGLRDDDEDEDDTAVAADPDTTKPAATETSTETSPQTTPEATPKITDAS